MSVKIGVLGGGQLGLMMGQSMAGETLELIFLDPNINGPASLVGQVYEGSFRNAEDVLRFGKEASIITIEIEDVHVDSLISLENEGKLVHPKPESIQIIKDKGKQKEFYRDNQLPTSDFVLVDGKKHLLTLLQEGKINYPFVFKNRIGGYDGKGVYLIDDQSELDKLPDVAAVIEDLIEIEKELSVLVARNESGEQSIFPIVEMVFDNSINLIDYQYSPAEISSEQLETCKQLGRSVSEELGMVGILAVELFLDKKGNIWINESAPRPHNSGHQTIEACNFSQFDLHLMAIQNQTLPFIQQDTLAAMVNLVGTGETGEAEYIGLDQIPENDESIYPHIYGKVISKPGRKMGHVTIISEDKETLLEKIDWVKKTIFVQGKKL